MNQSFPLTADTYKPTLEKYNVKIKTPLKPCRTERELTTAEILGMFEKKEALCMVYLPHFFTQCILFYLDQLLDYARTNKIEECKKFSRQFKAIKEDYIKALRHEMPPHIFDKFLNQREEYLGECGVNLTLIYYTFDNELKKVYANIHEGTLVCLATIIKTLIKYVNDFDRSVNRKIAEKIGMPCRNNGDARLDAIHSLCDKLTLGYHLGQNKNIEMCLNVIANITIRKINQLAEENNAQ